jgi:hypothetical protein
MWDTPGDIVPQGFSARSTRPGRFERFELCELGHCSANWDSGAALQSPSEEQHEKNNENDSADADSTIGSVSVVTTAAAKQQKQDQNQ